MELKETCGKNTGIHIEFKQNDMILLSEPLNQ